MSRPSTPPLGIGILATDGSHAQPPLAPSLLPSYFKPSRPSFSARGTKRTRSRSSSPGLASPPPSPGLRRIAHLKLTSSPRLASCQPHAYDLIRVIRHTELAHCPAIPPSSSTPLGPPSAPCSSRPHSPRSPDAASSSSNRSSPVKLKASIAPVPPTFDRSPALDELPSKRARRLSNSSTASVGALSEDESDDDASGTSGGRMSFPLPPQFRIRPSPLQNSFSLKSPPGAARGRCVVLGGDGQTSSSGVIVRTVRPEDRALPTTPAPAFKVRSARDHQALVAPLMMQPANPDVTTQMSTALGFKGSPPSLCSARARLLKLESHGSYEQASTEVQKVFALGYGRGLGGRLGSAIGIRRASGLREKSEEGSAIAAGGVDQGNDDEYRARRGPMDVGGGVDVDFADSRGSGNSGSHNAARRGAGGAGLGGAESGRATSEDDVEMDLDLQGVGTAWA